MPTLVSRTKRACASPRGQVTYFHLTVWNNGTLMIPLDSQPYLESARLYRAVGGYPVTSIHRIADERSYRRFEGCMGIKRAGAVICPGPPKKLVLKFK